jgi:hypothetical protein
LMRWLVVVVAAVAVQLVLLVLLLAVVVLVAGPMSTTVSLSPTPITINHIRRLAECTAVTSVLLSACLQPKLKGIYSQPEQPIATQPGPAATRGSPNCRMQLRRRATVATLCIKHAPHARPRQGSAQGAHSQQVR